MWRIHLDLLSQLEVSLSTNDFQTEDQISELQFGPTNFFSKKKKWLVSVNYLYKPCMKLKIFRQVDQILHFKFQTWKTTPALFKLLTTNSTRLTNLGCVTIRSKVVRQFFDGFASGLLVAFFKRFSTRKSGASTFWWIYPQRGDRIYLPDYCWKFWSDFLREKIGASIFLLPERCQKDNST